MLSGLILLLVFLLVYLQQSYQNAHGQLQKDMDKLFLEAVRESEDSLMQSVLLERLNVKVERLEEAIPPGEVEEVKTILIEPGMHPIIEKDSMIAMDERSFTQFRIESFEEETSASEIRINEKGDTTMSITFHADLNDEKQDQIKGSLSLFFAMSEDDIPGEQYLQRHWVGQSVLPNLSQEFAQLYQNSGLPPDWEMQNVDSLVVGNNQLVSKEYVDLISGEKTAVVLSNYQGYLYRQIAAEIGFSSLLFLVIALAFGMIWRTLQRQSRLIELKNDFISNITHELKTPITTVGVAIEALRNFNVLDNPNKTNEYLDISRQELDRLSLLVDKVLKISLFERQAPELRVETVDMKDLVTKVINSMRLQFEKLMAQVDFRLEGQQFQLQGDRIHLSSVIFNLIDNALKYSQQDPKIEIDLTHQQEHLVLKVKDHGIGIGKEYLDKIFDKFFRVPRGNQHNVKGYGLGLAYVASVVHQHQGEIQVESEQGQGTCFTITLPLDHESN